eukprot:TRINITY_DN26765_c0_g1_i1.p1 TRINITY_DN26765_c0_g1~~TRINITY_DN26765_c0_g1_i1.p1  ORF type:complete len:347 (+),score=26.09 TRINITY_DN26765_c0_g1_i1:44-1084(+)
MACFPLSCVHEFLSKLQRKCIPQALLGQPQIVAIVNYCSAEEGDDTTHLQRGTSATNSEHKADRRRVVVKDGRDRSFSLEREGFLLTRLPLDLVKGQDLYDPISCGRVLYPLAIEVLHACFPSAAKCIVFDHIVRNRARFEREGQQGSTRTAMLADGPARGVHGDYTVRSGFTRARQLLGPHEPKARIDQALNQRFAFVNVWVPLAAVERDPLGLIEWSSQRPRDVRTQKFIYTHRQGEIYRVLASEKHSWVYFSDMVPGECLVFKVFDSAEDGRARFSLHAALEVDPTPPSARARESIELRCIVFFGPLPASFADDFIAPHLVPGSADQVLSPERTELAPATDAW